MAGIFPLNGVTADLTKGALLDPALEEDCEALWYKPSCNPRMDYRAMNSVMSELLSAMNFRNIDYDCEALDNLARAISMCSITPIVFPPDVDDRIAGCYDGIEGTATIAQILALYELNLCVLPIVAPTLNTSTVAGCKAGSTVSFTMQSLADLFGGGPPEAGDEICHWIAYLPDENLPSDGLGVFNDAIQGNATGTHLVGPRFKSHAAGVLRVKFTPRLHPIYQPYNTVFVAVNGVNVSGNLQANSVQKVVDVAVGVGSIIQLGMNANSQPQATITLFTERSICAKKRNNYGTFEHYTGNPSGPPVEMP
jgi:hypothetical protein